MRLSVPSPSPPCSRAPDVVSQLLLAIPLCILYELALIAIWFTRRRRKKAESIEEAVL